MSQTQVAPAYRTPLWDKIFGVMALVVFLVLVVILLSGGQHGPGMHMPSANITEEALHNGAQHP